MAQKMQDPVHDQMRHVVGQGLALRLCLPRAGLPGDGDVAQRSGAAAVPRSGGCGAPPGASGDRSQAGQDSTFVGWGLPRKSAFRTAIRASSQPRSAISNPSAYGRGPPAPPAPRVRPAPADRSPPSAPPRSRCRQARSCGRLPYRPAPLKTSADGAPLRAQALSLASARAAQPARNFGPDAMSFLPCRARARGRMPPAGGILRKASQKAPPPLRFLFSKYPGEFEGQRPSSADASHPAIRPGAKEKALPRQRRNRITAVRTTAPVPSARGPSAAGCASRRGWNCASGRS